MARIVETDNHGGDYPDEKFVDLPTMSQPHARRVANAINASFPKDWGRFWKVVADDYELQPGFEP
ncbi:MAG: hypothetical protein KDG50_07130 [Chromatiales bacterium]|nr:hypothetical protein [Chromatiales bacterium]